MGAKESKRQKTAQAELDAQEKAKIEAERRKVLRPIKDRIYDYADGILKEPTPVFIENPDASAIIEWAFSELNDLSDCIKMKADDL